MDADYDNTNSVVSQTLSWVATSLNTDGTLKAGSVGQSQMVSGLFDDIVQDIIDEVQPLVDQAQGYAASAAGSSTTAQASATAADRSNTAAAGAATTATAASNGAIAARNTAQGYATTAQAAADDAGNADNDAQGAAALAQDYADVTQAWAEHMPDTIPPNILAVMGVTGDHWSSRWWANQAAVIATGTVNYRGSWNPVTNTPILASGGLVAGIASKKGDYYLVSVTGTSVPIDGQTIWVAGDWVISTGTAWQRAQSPAGPWLPLTGGTVSGPINVSVPGTPVTRSVQNALTDVVSVKSFGAIMDGLSHPLSTQYATLAAAQAVYPHAVALTDEIDWCAIQGAVNALNTAIRIPAGTALINHPVVSTSTTPIAVIGDGVNTSAIIQTTTGADGWRHTSTYGLQVFGLTLACNGVGGAAIRANFGNTGNTTFTLRDVYIVGNINNAGGQLSNFWHDGIWVYNPSVTQFDHFWILGSNGGYLGNMGDAIYLKCRAGTPSGSFDVGISNGRIGSYQRGVVIDSIDDSTGNPTAVNLQGIMLQRVNYAALMQFVTVIGGCLELVLSHCQGAGFGSVVHADRANTVTIRDGLFFISAPGSQAVTGQTPQDVFYASDGSLWWIKDNEVTLSPTATCKYIFNFNTTFLQACLRDNQIYVTSTATAAGFVTIDNGSSNIIESGTTFSNWRGWPLWTNANTDTAAGGNVPAFQTLVTRGQPTGDQWASQGSVIGWNYGGAGGRTSFINSRATAVGGFEWYTTPSASTATPTLLSTLTADGNLFLFSAGNPNQAITLDAAAPTTRGFAMKTNGQERWMVYANNTAEPNDGSNVGTDFGIGRYTDAGAANGTPLAISRATGLTTLTSLAVTGHAGFNNTAPIAKPNVAGAWAGNTAGKALCVALASYGLITDTTTA